MKEIQHRNAWKILMFVGLITTAFLLVPFETSLAYMGVPQGGEDPYMMLLDEVPTELMGGAHPDPAWAEVHEWGWTGTDVVVAVADTGVDLGNDLVNTHLDLRGRIHAVIDYAGNGGIDYYGHGTHVAGIAAGSGAIATENPPGMRRGLGIAPNALIVSQNVLNDPTSSYSSKAWHQKIFRDATQNDASISSNSWCWAQFGVCITGYRLQSEWVDELVRDSDDTQAGDQPIVIVFAAGNDGPGTGSVSSLGQAKNVIGVAASESERTEGGSGSDDFDEIASFSSRGPSSDNRLKPDITATGTWVSSALSQAGSPNWCYGVTGEWGGNIDSDYEYCSGTSMAAPQVSGGAALFTQYYLDRTSVLPSPALVKGALINSAEDMPTFTDPIPNFDEGWGRMDLITMLDDSIPRAYFDQVIDFETPGQMAVFDVEVVSAGDPLKITLAWTDSPGDSTKSPSLGYIENDLDLKVIRPSTGDVWIGNTFFTSRSTFLSTGWTPANPTSNNAWENWDTDANIYDDRNNVENVFIQSPSSGTYQVQVSARSLPQPSQDFALVILGGNEAAHLDIENGADKIAFEVVRLNLESDDAIEMRFSNDGATWSDWEPYAATKYPWLLYPGEGTKCVFAQIKGADGVPKNVEPAYIYVQYWDDRKDVSQYGRGTYGAFPATGYNPRIAVDPTDVAYLRAVWWQEETTPDRHHSVVFAWSPDNGATWTAPIYASYAFVNSKYPDIVVGGGYVHIVWQQEDSPGSGNWNIYYSRWTLAGSPDILPTPIAPAPGAQEHPRIAHGPAGDGVNFAVHVVFQDELSGDVMYMRNGLNGAGGWTGPTPLSPTMPPFSTRPAIDVRDEFVHVVFEHSIATTMGDIVYVRNVDHGMGSWTLEWVPWQTTNIQRRPDVAAADNFVHVVWDELEVGLGFERILYLGNTENGEIWGWRTSAQVLSLQKDGMSTSASTSPSADASSGIVAVAWQGNAENYWEIYFARHYDYGDDAISPWEHWSRVTFAGYHARDAAAPALALGPQWPPQVNFLWQDEVWNGWDISYKNDVTSRGEPPFYDAIDDLSVEIVMSDAMAGDLTGRTYQESITMNAGTWEPAGLGGQVWNRHVLTEEFDESDSAELEAIYRLSIPHAEGHEDGPGTDYYLRICAETASTTDYFGVYYGYSETTDQWGFMGDILIDEDFECGQHDFNTNHFGHHGYLWIKIQDINRDPVDHVIDTLIIWSPEFEDIDGAIRLDADLPAGFAKTDLHLTWTPSDDDPAVTPGGQVDRYDIYMANEYHDSYFIKVASVPSGDPTPEFILRGGAVAGSPETVVEGPVALRYPRDAYFTVVARDADGRTAPPGIERVGKYTIDLPAEQVLLSLPLITPTTSTPEVFAPIEGHWKRVLWYDASDEQDHWKEYTTYKPYNDLPNVDRTMGLWLTLTSDGDGFLHTGLFTVVGIIPASTEISLYWDGSSETSNLVGYPYLTVEYHDPFGPEAVEDALCDVCYVSVWTYDPDNPPDYLKQLSDNDYMLPGLGYWISVSSADTWTLINSFPAECLI